MDGRVLGIAEARSGLSALVDTVSTSPETVVVIGSHRKPEAVLIPYSRYLELRDSAGNANPVDLAAVQARKGLISRIGGLWGMHDIAVFGSVARGDARPDSDVDFLVTAEPGRSYFDVAGFEADLEQVLGRPVDVLTRDALDPERKRDRAMLDDAVPL